LQLPIPCSHPFPDHEKANLLFLLKKYKKDTSSLLAINVREAAAAAPAERDKNTTDRWSANPGAGKEPRHRSASAVVVVAASASGAATTTTVL
jgi:hypothetical protein